jgi:hypothetical protein
MTDKEKIREEIEKKLELMQYQVHRKDAYKELKGILAYIDEVQKEPVSKDLEVASKEWLSSQLDKSYANYGEAKMMELTHFDGYAMLDAIEFGANWQKQQMMAKAVDATVHIDAGGYPYIPQIELYDYDKDIPLAKEGEKVKVIVIKEDKI